MILPKFKNKPVFIFNDFLFESYKGFQRYKHFIRIQVINHYMLHGNTLWFYTFKITT